MSIANFGGSGLISQPVRSRSQLVTNRFLIALSKMFGWGAFTSRDVSNRFGLDFLNTAKTLSRMSKRPNYLLSAVHVSRPYGGYENSYTISTKGWSKISYLQGHSVRAQKPQARDIQDETWADYYLVKGKGKEKDLIEDSRFKIFRSLATRIFQSFPSRYPSMDEEDRLLLQFDPRILPLEAFHMPQDNLLKTVDRAALLQHNGLIPHDINLPLFVVNAFERGSSSSVILLSLVIRGGINLRDELFLSRIFSSLKSQLAAKLATSSTTPKDCENCFRSEKFIDTYKLYVNLLEDKIGSLRSELEDSRQDNLRLHNRISKFQSHIAMNSKCLRLVTEGLEKIKDPRIILPVKAYINYTLAGLVLMNSHASQT